MSVTLYFAKLNLDSEEIFNLYDNPKKKQEIMMALNTSIKNSTVWNKENYYEDESGQIHKTLIEYSIHVVNENDEKNYIEGWLYKKSKLYYKTLDPKTNLLVQKSTENMEGVRFVVDIDEGFVGYNTSNRLGYKEFTEAFVYIINLGEEKNKTSFRYSMSMCTRGINLADVKSELKSIGRIKELHIRMQPPNPSDELLEELSKRCDGIVSDFKESNVTSLDILYNTKGVNGINISAPFVEEKLDDIQGMYSTLSTEESMRKGYVSVEATSISGKKFSSGETRPFRKVILGFDEMLGACMEAFRQLR